jgi:hypothetical protein
MSPPKDDKCVFNPEAILASASDFGCQLKTRKSEIVDDKNLTVKQRFADSKTDHTSANGSHSSVKSSPDTKDKLNKMGPISGSKAAMKLIFEEKEDVPHQ